jgi:hypothetical protein
MDRPPHRVARAAAVAALLTLAGCGSGPPGEPLGQEGAHEHGVADLSIVADGPGATVAFQVPAGDILGFEGGEPTAEERASAREVLRRLESELPAMLGLPEELGCRVAAVSWRGAAADVMGDADGADGEDGRGEEEGTGHSDVGADFELACSAPLAGTTLELQVGRHFDSIGRLDLQAVSEARQFGRRVPADGFRVEL